MCEINNEEAQKDALIRVENVSKKYKLPSGSFTALDKISLKVGKGEFLAVVGKSGSGKTTLLNVLTGIDSPTSGEIYVGTEAIHTLNQEQLSLWRGWNVGIVFQFFQLLPTLTVAENVMLPMDFCKTFPASERRDRAYALLNRLGIAEQGEKLPSALSGGQQQRAAIARALANDPPIIVADEPTGNLDTQSTDEVFNAFSSFSKEGKTIIMVTHERNISRYFTRVVTLEDGVLRNETTYGI